MDKFKFGLFDIFVYTLPGFIVLTSIFLWYNDFNIDLSTTIKGLFTIVSTLTFYSFLLLIVISYIIGFVFHYFGYKYFAIIGKRIWNNRIKDLKKNPLTNEQKFALVRHYSKENFVYIEQWYAFRGMSFNLSLAFLILFIVLLVKVIGLSLFKFDWIILTLCCLLFSIILLRKAITFHQWSHKTINDTIKTLNLDNREITEPNKV